LHGDVQAGDVEGLEHNLSSVLAVLRSVQRRLSEEEVVILGLRAEVLEDAVLPEVLHVGTVVDLAMANRVKERIGLVALQRLIADEEIEIFSALLLCGGLLLALSLLSGNHGGNDVLRLAVSSVTHLCVTGSIVDHDRRQTGLAHR